MIVVAKDENGREWNKSITFHSEYPRGTTISFGYPCEYYISDLLKHPLPYEKDLCIDISGRNHAGSPVSISKENMSRLLQEWLDEMITDKENIS